MLSTSLKFPFEVYNVNLIPEEPTLENYAYVLEDGRFYLWFWNSLLIATITTVSNVLFDSLVGYTLCKFRFPGPHIVFIAILSTLMIPTEMLVIPWYLMSQQLGWLDSYWGIMFPGLMTAFGMFLMKQFFETVPDDFIEAARIDGLNEFQIWWTVAMPLVEPALAALAIFVFLGNWTAFLWPLIVTNSAGHVHAARRPFDLRRRGRRGVGADHDRRRDLDAADAGRVPDLPALHHPRRGDGGAEGMTGTDVRHVSRTPSTATTVLAPLFEGVKAHYAAPHGRDQPRASGDAGRDRHPDAGSTARRSRAALTRHRRRDRRRRR